MNIEPVHLRIEQIREDYERIKRKVDISMPSALLEETAKTARHSRRAINDNQDGGLNSSNGRAK